MSAQITAETRGLIGEIFELTGQKVEFDDPIVVAALIHSQLIRRAGLDAVTGIQAAVAQSLVELADAVKAERQAAADVDRGTAAAYTQIIAAARAASDAEVPKMHAQFVNIAQDVLQQVRKDASAAAPYAWKVKVGLGLCAIMLLGGAAGAVIGAKYGGAPGARPSEEAREIAAGRDFLALIPQLDAPTKARISRMVERNHQNEPGTP